MPRNVIFIEIEFPFEAQETFDFNHFDNRTRLVKFIFLFLALIVFFVSNVTLKFWIGISIGTKVFLSYKKKTYREF